MDHTSIEEVYNIFTKRNAFNTALKAFIKHRVVIFMAPTGYGKTLFSLKLYDEIADSKHYVHRLIHVVPYRALVKQIFEDKFKPYRPDIAGYQSHEEIDPTYKSPFFLRRLVVTTSDSFFYNLFRIPVGEMHKVLSGRSQGHYYVPLASIYSSLIVFDEAHIYLNEFVEEKPKYGADIAGLITAISSMRALHRLDIPLILETATLKSSVLEYIVKNVFGHNVPIIYVCHKDKICPQYLKLVKRELYVIRISDDKFEERHGIKWYTEITSENTLPGLIKKHCSSGPVIVVRNTVRRAIDTFDKYKSLCEDAVLIHGLLSNVDRRSAVEKALEIVKKGSPGLIVSTQVIEAGVEVGYNVLITDPAPIENIAQRAGRLCRERTSLKHCIDEGAYVYILNDISETYPYTRENVDLSLSVIKNVLGKGYQIDWRLFSNRPGYVSFTDLVEKSYVASLQGLPAGTGVYEAYLEAVDTSSRELRELMELMGEKRLARTGFFVNVIIPPYEDKTRVEDLEVVSIDLERLLNIESSRSPDDRCLEYIDDHPVLVIAYRDTSSKLSFKKVKPRLRLGGNIAKMSIWKIAGLLEPVREEDRSIGGYIENTFLLAKTNSENRLPCYMRHRGLRIW